MSMLLQRHRQLREQEEANKPVVAVPVVAPVAPPAAKPVAKEAATPKKKDL